MKRRNVASWLLTGCLLIAVVAVACGPAAPAPTPTPGKPAAAPAAPTPTTAPAASPAAKAPYKLGVVSSLSGPAAPVGSAVRDSLLLVQEQLNAKGGINGHRVDLVILDDESDESKGVLAVKKLIEVDKVLAVLGPPTSGVAFAVAPIVNEAQVPMVTTASTRRLVDPVLKYIFKPAPDEELVWGAIYDFFKKKGITKIALLSQGAGFGRGGREYLEKTAAANGISVVAKDEYGPTDTDMRSQLTKIKATDAQYLVVYGAEVAATLIARQMKELGVKIPMTGPESIALPTMVDMAGDAYDGLQAPMGKVYVADQLPDADPQKAILLSYKDAFTKKYGKPVGTFEAFGYEQLMVAAKGLEMADPDVNNVAAARNKIRDAIEGIKNLPVIAGMVTFSPTDHRGLQLVGTYAWVEVRDKKYTLMKQP